MFLYNGYTWTNGSSGYALGVNGDVSCYNAFITAGGTLGNSSLTAYGLNTADYSGHAGVSQNNMGNAGLGYDFDIRGPFCATRLGAASQYAYLRAYQSPQDTTASAGLNTNNFCVYATISGCTGGLAIGYAPPFGVDIRGIMIGGPVSPALWAKIWADWDAFEAALGRKVP